MSQAGISRLLFKDGCRRSFGSRSIRSEPVMSEKRAARVGDQIRREIAVLLMEKVRDPRIRGVTLTGISLSNDLKYAKIFFSTMGRQEDIKRVQAGLDSATGFIKRQIASRMELRYIPEIVFRYDPSLERGEQIEKVLEKIRPDAHPEVKDDNGLS